LIQRRPANAFCLLYLICACALLPSSEHFPSTLYPRPRRPPRRTPQTRASPAPPRSLPRRSCSSAWHQQQHGHRHHVTSHLHVRWTLKSTVTRMAPSHLLLMRLNRCAVRCRMSVRCGDVTCGQIFWLVLWEASTFEACRLWRTGKKQCESRNRRASGSSLPQSGEQLESPWIWNGGTSLELQAAYMQSNKRINGSKKMKYGTSHCSRRGRAIPGHPIDAVRHEKITTTGGTRNPVPGTTPYTDQDPYLVESVGAGEL
jgi:hypothetical protein